MEELDAFVGIKDYFMNNSDKFKSMFDCADPHEQPFPDHWNDKLDNF
jgi:hypothetical protein